MQDLKRAGWFLAVALSAALAAGAQSQSQQPAPKPDEKKTVKKAKKVWTEDDVAGLRKPSDEYADKKAAEERAAREATMAAAAAQKTEQTTGEKTTEEQPRIDPVSGKPIYDPDSPEGLRERLANWEESVVKLEQALNEARSRLTQTTDPDRWESAKLEVDLLSQNIVDTQKRIEELKVRIAALPPKKEGAAPAPKPNPPAPPQG